MLLNQREFMHSDHLRGFRLPRGTRAMEPRPEETSAPRIAHVWRRRLAILHLNPIKRHSPAVARPTSFVRPNHWFLSSWLSQHFINSVGRPGRLSLFYRSSEVLCPVPA